MVPWTGAFVILVASLFRKDQRRRWLKLTTVIGYAEYVVRTRYSPAENVEETEAWQTNRLGGVSQFGLSQPIGPQDFQETVWILHRYPLNHGGIWHGRNQID